MSQLTVFVIAVLISLGNSFPQSARERNFCQKVSSSCICSTFGVNYEIQCPSTDPKVTVSIYPKDHVKIECESGSERDYDEIPQIDVGNITVVQMKRCAIPSGQKSFTSILEKLKVTNVRSFLFQSGVGSSYGPWSIQKGHLSGFKDLERLKIGGKDLTTIPSDLFEDMKKLSWLEWKSDITSLPEKIFDPLENLKFLELGYNKLRSLPGGLFQNLKKLTYLNLYGNQLKNLTKDVFTGATNVDSLDLSANGMDTLDPDVFTDLINMTMINLSTNNFTSLPEGLFRKNLKLRIVKMIDNRVSLDTLPSDFLANLPELEEVKIKVGLKTIPETVFDGSNNIVNLTLRENQIEILPNYIFKDQSKLLVLDLRENRINELSDDLFQVTKSLSILKLSHNNITRISLPVFAELGALTELYLDNNQIESINQLSFSTLKDLRVLDLSYNRLTFMDEMSIDGLPIEIGSPFLGVSNLEILNLRHNAIVNTQDLSSLTKLHEIDYSWNNISSLGHDDFNFVSLNVKVNYSHNEIQDIHFDVIHSGNQYTKTEVYLDDDSIDCSCRLLKFIKFQSQTLNAPKSMYDNIKIHSDSLKCASPPELNGRLVSSLEPLELLCPLDSPSTLKKLCPEKCICMVRAEDRTLIMNCSNAGLLKVPMIPDAKDIRSVELIIENNNITQLPNVTELGVTNVSKIHASGNQIKEVIPSQIPDNLLILQLHNNNIERINKTVFATVKTITLKNNPLICDCKTTELLGYITQNRKRFTDYNEITCLGGEVFFSQATSDDICSTNKVIFIATGSILAAIGILFGACAAFYYKFNHEIKVWLYAHNWCLWFVSEDEVDKDLQYDAFISYSHKDEDFVVEHLVPELEHGAQPYKLCLHIRDWVVGDWIPTQIEKSVNNSRRTIVVLSPNFLESVWGKMEFRAAHKKAIEEKRARVIVVIYGDVGDIELLDPELKAYLKMNTYVKWGDPWFWKKLKYALPHRQGYLYDSINGTNDKLELIKPTSVTPPLTTPPAEAANRNFLNANNNINHNGKLHNGLNGHINNAFVINTNARQSDV